MARNRTYLLDVALVLQDEDTITANHIGEVLGQPRSVELGSFNTMGDVVFDISAMKVSAGTETYTLWLMGSSTEDFSDDVNVLTVVQMGAQPFGSALLFADRDTVPGKHVLPFQNSVVNEDGPARAMAWGRLAIDMFGTSPSLTMSAYISQRK